MNERRLIDADALIEKYTVVIRKTADEKLKTEIAVLLKDIEEQPTIDAQPHWIPCSERLPRKEKKRYWVCTDTEYQCECRWTNNRFGLGEGEWGWSIFDTPQYSKPIAWMPLPKPYREDGE